MVDQLLEQHRRAVVVDRDVAVDRVHALADADLGGEVDDLRRRPCSALRTAVSSRMSPTTNSTSAVEVVRASAALVDLLDQAVEHADPVAALEQRARHVAADEAGAAGDEDRLCQRLVSGRFNGRDRVARRRSRRAASCRRPSGAFLAERRRAAISLTSLAARLTPRRDRALFLKNLPLPERPWSSAVTTLRSGRNGNIVRGLLVAEWLRSPRELTSNERR